MAPYLRSRRLSVLLLAMAIAMSMSRVTARVPRPTIRLGVGKGQEKVEAVGARAGQVPAESAGGNSVCLALVGALVGAAALCCTRRSLAP